MAVSSYFTLALLVLLLLPVAVLPLEGRRAPDMLYALVGGAGLVLSAWFGGWPALGMALATGLAVALVIGGIVTILRAKFRLRLLTGGQIKLMAAGATWLDPTGAVLMLAIVIIGMFMVAVARYVRENQARPDSAMVVVLAIIMVAVQQHILPS